MDEEKQTFMGVSELSRQSGVPVSTIKFYLRKGLLTRPRKTSPTMAYYTKAHLTELAEIRRLKEGLGMPLDRIKEVLEPGSPAGWRDPAAGSVEFQEREGRIMDAAMALFSDKGYEKATIADIADAARMSKSTFYLHFKNKKDLFLRCFQRILDKLVTENILALAPGEDIAEILRKIPEPFFREYPQWNAMASQMRAASVYDSEEFGDRFEEVLEMFVEPVRQLMETDPARKRFRRINAKLLAVMLLGAVDYTAYYVMRGKMPGSAGQVLEQGLDMLLNGILKK